MGSPLTCISSNTALLHRISVLPGLWIFFSFLYQLNGDRSLLHFLSILCSLWVYARMVRWWFLIAIYGIIGIRRVFKRPCGGAGTIWPSYCLGDFALSTWSCYPYNMFCKHYVLPYVFCTSLVHFTMIWVRSSCKFGVFLSRHLGLPPPTVSATLACPSHSEIFIFFCEVFRKQVCGSYHFEPFFLFSATSCVQFWACCDILCRHSTLNYVLTSNKNTIWSQCMFFHSDWHHHLFYPSWT